MMLTNKNAEVTVTQRDGFIISLTSRFGPDWPSSGDGKYINDDRIQYNYNTSVNLKCLLVKLGQVQLNTICTLK
jgi:hypothetical protein